VGVLVAAALGGLAVALLMQRQGGSRLDVLLGVPAASAEPTAGARSRAQTRLAVCLLLAGSLLLVLPLPVGLPTALVAVLAGPGLLDRLEPAEERRRRQRLRADLPLLLDLLAACLAGGATLPEAAGAVAAAVGGPAGERLAVVTSALRVGTSPADAWAALAGPAPDDDPLAPVSRALARAAEGGAPVAGAVARLATDARLRAKADGEAAARRAGVLAVAPLGLCFLPAFVLLGVVPVIAGLAGPLLAGW
jgi:pilus assembly protein TadC